MYPVGTRYIVLASLCLVVKLGCIALLLELQLASSPSRYSKTHFFSPSPFCDHGLTPACKKHTSVQTTRVHGTSGFSLPSA